MLEGAVWRDGESIFEGLALNDVVVSRGATASMVELRVDVGDEFVANMRADGIIVASPTGSTAYALSAGGPIMHPSIGGWLLVPIASHTLSNRPIVLPDTGEVRMEIVAGRDASVNFDMQSLASLLHGDRITVRRSEPTRCAFSTPGAGATYDTLRQQDALERGRRAESVMLPDACIALRDFVIVRELDLDLCAGFSCAHGRDRRGQVHLDRRACSSRWAQRADAGAGARGRSARRHLAPSSTAPAHLGAWLDQAGFESEWRHPAPATCASTAQGKSRAWINGSTSHRQRSCARPADHLARHSRPACLAKPDPGPRLGARFARQPMPTCQHPALWARPCGRSGAHAQRGPGRCRADTPRDDPAQRERERLAWQIGESRQTRPRRRRMGRPERRAHTRLAHARKVPDRRRASAALELPCEGEDGGAQPPRWPRPAARCTGSRNMLEPDVRQASGRSDRF